MSKRQVSSKLTASTQTLFDDLRELIIAARQDVVRTVNSALVMLYWNVGRRIHEDVIRYALSKNVVVVAASGNDGTSERYYPGALPGVMAVGAVGDTGAVTGFTSYGESKCRLSSKDEESEESVGIWLIMRSHSFLHQTHLILRR